GADMFDCVMPTRVARHGTAFTSNGPVNLRNERFRADPEPLARGCGCYTCQKFPRAYLRHLTIAGEILASTLLTIHNLHFFLELMRQAREQIESGGFQDWHLSWIRQ